MYMQKDYEEKEREINRLKEELKQARLEAAETAAAEAIVTQRKSSFRGSPIEFRPHSYHMDTSGMSGSLSQPAPTEEDKTFSSVLDTS